MRYIAGLLLYVLGLIEVVVRLAVTLALIFCTFGGIFFIRDPTTLVCEPIQAWVFAERLLRDPGQPGVP